ncbi:MAG TPA: glycosyltransferase family 39 protein [bacterium]|nr:glycosyltransferase family 39 protein [bacterium]HQL60893.1 glycosyltransferase family 39 protein [bacterium]
MTNREKSTTPSSLFAEAGIWFVLLCCSSLVFYPHWFSQGQENALGSFWLVWLAIAAGVLLLYWLFRGDAEPFIKEPAFLYPALRVLWPFLALCFLAHLPFLNAPIVTGLDAQEHAGVPAVVVGIVRDSLPVPLPLIAWPGLAILFLAFRYFIWNESGKRGSHGLIKVVLFCFLVGFAEYEFLTRIDTIGQNIDPRFISRYPALSRYLFGILYSLFGIYEWVGRVSQIVLTGIAAIYLYRIGILFFKETAAVAAAVILLFLPPIFHYGNLNMIDCGTVALPVVAEFYLLRYFEESRRRDYCRALFLLTAGVFYKQVLVFLVPVAAVQWAVREFFIRRQLRIRDALGFGLPAGMFLVFQWLARSNQDVPDTAWWSHYLDPSVLLTPVAMLPTSFTWPILVLTVMGIWIAWRKDRMTRRPLLHAGIWCVVYWLCYLSWKSPENIRQALPSYPPLILLAGVGFAQMVDGLAQWVRKSLIVLSLACLLWLVLLFPRAEPTPDVRPIKDSTWMNLTNYKSFFLPYAQLFRYLQENVSDGSVIYAPMANEPSRYYLAAYGMGNRISWLGEPWAQPEDQSIETLENYCRSWQVDYLILPNSRWAQTVFSKSFLDNILIHGAQFAVPIERFNWGSEYLMLYEVSW